MDFIRLVMWLGLERLSRKGYEGSKFICRVSKFDTKIISQVFSCENGQGFPLQTHHSFHYFLHFSFIYFSFSLFFSFVTTFLLANSCHSWTNLFYLIFEAF